MNGLLAEQKKRAFQAKQRKSLIKDPPRVCSTAFPSKLKRRGAFPKSARVAAASRGLDVLATLPLNPHLRTSFARAGKRGEGLTIWPMRTAKIAISFRIQSLEISPETRASLMPVLVGLSATPVDSPNASPRQGRTFTSRCHTNSVSRQSESSWYGFESLESWSSKIRDLKASQCSER